MEKLAKLEAERGNSGYVLGSKTGGSGKVYDTIEKAKGKVPGASVSLAGEGRKKQRVANNEMCIFLILNISSLLLIPVNMIAYQSQYGNVNPAVIIAPAIAATAVVYCKMMDRKKRKV